MTAADGLLVGEAVSEVKHRRAGGEGVRRVVRRLLDTLLILAAIVYLTQFLLILAALGRERQPASFVQVAGQALTQSLDYVFRHPQTYLWHKVETGSFNLVLTTFSHSIGLLLLSLAIATVSGWALGLLMALRQRRAGSMFIFTLTVLGTSTPSFLLAMLLWIINIRVHNRFDVPALPPTGFGWDAHLIMPALVLAARPLAQIAQVTYVQVSQALGQDFIRTAHAKGLSARMVRDRHAIPNIIAPVLTTVGTSLRYSLSSLPVVEYFFLWPGVGLLILQAIDADMPTLVTDSIVCLGLFFLVVNLLLDLALPLLDPRLRDTSSNRVGVEGMGLNGLKEGLVGIFNRQRTRGETLPPLPRSTVSRALLEAGEPAATARATWAFKGLASNLPLLIGGALVVGMILVGIFAPRLTAANPYQSHGVMTIDGVIGAPPYPPSDTFPWGTDHIGRDVQALVLYGARQTLLLAFFGMLARLVLGSMLGAVAGWQQGGRFDRLVMGATNVWAAFPTTIFALLLIQGLGIQQGMWVFVVALCVVGWGEVAQTVRQQVIHIKPQLFIEAARSIGARASRTLAQHVMPGLLPMLIVLGVLEMGGILMLLAELGFLNTFLGGGFRVEIGEVGQMQPIVAYFSDIPEWGAMLANVRQWWRSYPWMAWYPGAAFFLAILSFNLFGEGLRRFFERSRINLGRLFGRYALPGAVAATLLLVWLLRSATPLADYQGYAESFDAQHVLHDVETLASAEYGGRETGTPGAEQTVRFIAERMAEIGLFPAGDSTPTKDQNPFIQTQIVERPRLTGVPQLTIEGDPGEALIYREDFVERPVSMQERAQGVVVGVALGPEPSGRLTDPYGLGRQDLLDKVLIVPEENLARLKTSVPSAILVITQDSLMLERRFLFPGAFGRGKTPPQMYISPETSDRLLQTTGTSLAEFENAAAQLGPGEAVVTGDGVSVTLEIPLSAPDGGETPTVEYYNIIGFIPGSGAEMQTETGASMDSQVIVVSAYYDGLGIGPDGTFYPGANDNASGIATLLELARLMKESPYQPKRTIVFVAWAGGERNEALSVTSIMSAKVGFSGLNVETVMELSGVGAGDGKAVAFGEGSSYRLVQLYQKAAARLGVETTTRGRGPHYAMPDTMAFGGRDALSLHVSWDGSDRTAHTPDDAIAAIDIEKLRQIGQSAMLTLSVLSREPTY